MAQLAPCADQCHVNNIPCEEVPSSFDTVPVPGGLCSSESILQHLSHCFVVKKLVSLRRIQQMEGRDMK